MPDKGSVEIGKQADLALPDANLIGPINDTRQRHAVTHGARVYDRYRPNALLSCVSDPAAPAQFATIWPPARQTPATPRRHIASNADHLGAKE